MPSSVIADMFYNAENAVLRIRFVSGLVYEYQKVPVEIFKAMKMSRSKGTYLNKHIQGYYEYKKINRVGKENCK